ncbi:MAG: Signal peptidase I P [Elusimicrobia bacterium]|nr:Signal peptidase I P [Elusimicrobiota bacterium]MCG3205196.1 Signal peptidase I P [Elusimicrobiota bacterium]
MKKGRFILVGLVLVGTLCLLLVGRLVYRIPGDSMAPTLVSGDRLILKRIDSTHRSLQRGDIVFFLFPARSKDSPHYGKSFIKRIIGMGGDKIEIVEKKVLVNGQKIEESYATFVESTIYPRTKVYSGDQFQREWESARFEGFGGKDIRDNFGPIVVPQGHLFLMGDNRDRSFDSRFWGPLPIQNVSGYPSQIVWPTSRKRKFEL